MSSKNEPLKVACGPLKPINERMRLKLLISEEMRKRAKAQNHLNLYYTSKYA